jgi:hypothetical protein
MTTIENLRQLALELQSLSSYYSGTLAGIKLAEELEPVNRVLSLLEEKEDWVKRLYYKRMLKENINRLSSKESEKLNNNWLTIDDMIKLCDKYNIYYNVIDFKNDYL